MYSIYLKYINFWGDVMRLFNLLITFLFIVSLAACGGGGGGSPPDNTDNTQPADPDPTPTPDPTPVISGFNFTLSEGDFWEYKWDSVKRITDASGTDIDNDNGRLRLTLGTPTQINGINTYKLIVAGNSTQYSSNFLRAWKYLAINNNQLLGSKDGLTLEVLFDGMTGYWPGTGLFNSFSNLVVATQSTIDNNYITSPAISISNSSSSNQCEYFPGYGTICTGDVDSTLREKEYYLPNIGPVGAYYYSSTYYGGTYPQSFTTTRNVGLVATSFLGDVISDDLEIESNDSKTLAQTVRVSVPMTGYIKRNDPGTSDSQVAANTVNPDQRIADWYEITVATSSSRSIALSFSGTFSDLDLYLFDGNGLKIGESHGDNQGTGIYTETISRSLSAGTYYIGIQAFTTRASGRKSEYTLLFR